jgi:cbb3-type cytochrome oxidase subunit 1
MTEMENVGLRFVRWGAGMLMLGLLTGYGPLGHYLRGGVTHACPWAPVHGHVATLGWMGMTLFGLVYRAIPSWANGATPALRLANAHFMVCVIAVLGVFANGIIGYRILDALVDGFYYRPVTSILNLWLSIDGVFLSLYGVGCLMFLSALLRSTRYAPPATSTPETTRAVVESR